MNIFTRFSSDFNFRHKTFCILAAIGTGVALLVYGFIVWHTKFLTPSFESTLPMDARGVLTCLGVLMLVCSCAVAALMIIPPRQPWNG